MSATVFASVPASALCAGAEVGITNTMYFLDDTYVTGSVNDEHVRIWEEYHACAVMLQTFATPATRTMDDARVAYTDAVLERLHRMNAVLKSGTRADMATWHRRLAEAGDGRPALARLALYFVRAGRSIEAAADKAIAVERERVRRGFVLLSLRM